MTLTFVPDPDVDDTIGADLADEIRAAAQPIGDCAACGSVLGEVPLRLDVRGFDDFHLVTLRHASCQPAPDNPGLVFAPSESTYQVAAAQVHALVPPDPPSRWSLRRRQPEPERRPYTVLLLNPSVDVFTVRAGQTSLVGPFHDRGFAPPGEATLGDPDAGPRAGIYLMCTPTSATVADTLTGGTYHFDDSPELVDTLTQGGGALLVITHRHWISHAQTDRTMLGRIMQDPSTATIWLTAEPTH